ncbi:T9SS type A sorting domain-containing protein [Bacteroidota bacterium]
MKLAVLVTFISAITFGQTIEFVKQTGSDNPLNSADVGTGVNSASVDIDNDGDFDLFIGNSSGTIRYYKNISTVENPNVFEEKTGADNLLNLVSVGANSIPTFVDIDGDGDFDVFVGSTSGIAYYENEGSVTGASFVLKTGIANPLSGLVAAANHSYSASFVDIDSDLDIDCFVGWIDYETADSSGILYYKNIGSVMFPVFENQLAENNPFNSFNELYPNPIFIDIDADNDFDAFIGIGDGTYSFYENITEGGTLTLSKDNLHKENVVMYPNPAISNVTFAIENKELKIELFTLSGLLVYRGVLTSENAILNVQSFAKGIYIVRLDDGKNKIVKKLVIRK